MRRPATIIGGRFFWRFAVGASSHYCNRIPAPDESRKRAMSFPFPPVCGVILAGGRSSRMGGGDKTLLDAGGQTLLARCVARLAPQAGPLALNANGDPARFAACGLPVIADPPDAADAGPLAGVLAGLTWLHERAPGCRWLLTVAGDTPLFPADLAVRLLAGATEQGARLAVAASGGRTHPVFGLWPADLLDELRHAVTVEGVRRVFALLDRYPVATVEWPVIPHDPFFNVNTPADAAQLAKLLS